MHHTLTADNTPPPPKAPEVLGSLFQETTLEKIKLESGDFAVGKLIRELHLRSKVGVTIVGIERDGNGLVNPGPDEEIGNNDVLLILGRSEQIREAREFLETGKEP